MNTRIVKTMIKKLFTQHQPTLTACTHFMRYTLTPKEAQDAARTIATTAYGIAPATNTKRPHADWEKIGYALRRRTAHTALRPEYLCYQADTLHKDIEKVYLTVIFIDSFDPKHEAPTNTPAVYFTFHTNPENSLNVNPAKDHEFDTDFGATLTNRTPHMYTFNPVVKDAVFEISLNRALSVENSSYAISRRVPLTNPPLTPAPTSGKIKTTVPLGEEWETEGNATLLWDGVVSWKKYPEWHSFREKAAADPKNAARTLCIAPRETETAPEHYSLFT